jgi:hypothetical protein
MKMRKATTFAIAPILAFVLSQEWIADGLFFIAREMAEALGRTQSVRSWGVCFAVLAIAAALVLIMRAAAVRHRRYGVAVLVVACLGMFAVVHREGWNLHDTSAVIAVGYIASWLLTLLFTEIGFHRVLREAAQQSVQPDRREDAAPG